MVKLTRQLWSIPDAAIGASALWSFNDADAAVGLPTRHMHRKWRPPRLRPYPIKINNSARPPNRRGVVDARGRVWIYAFNASPIGLSSSEAAGDLFLKSRADPLRASRGHALD
jgi:hypothetical protein